MLVYQISRDVLIQLPHSCLRFSLTPQRLGIVSNLLLSQIAFRWTISVSHILVSICVMRTTVEGAHKVEVRRSLLLTRSAFGGEAVVLDLC